MTFADGESDNREPQSGRRSLHPLVKHDGAAKRFAQAHEVRGMVGVLVRHHDGVDGSRKELGAEREEALHTRARAKAGVDEHT